MGDSIHDDDESVALDATDEYAPLSPLVVAQEHIAVFLSEHRLLPDFKKVVDAETMLRSFARNEADARIDGKIEKNERRKLRPALEKEEWNKVNEIRLVFNALEKHPEDKIILEQWMELEQTHPQITRLICVVATQEKAFEIKEVMQAAVENYALASDDPVLPDILTERSVDQNDLQQLRKKVQALLKPQK